MIEVEWGGYTFTLKPGAQIDVTNGKYTVTYMSEVVVTEQDLIIFARGYTCGKEKGWGALI